MTTLITVIDYGAGNLYSVQNALIHCEVQVLITNKASDILAASHVVLPGVGAFADGMQGLRELNLIEPIRDYALKGGKLLGICLGMQMLFSRSEEFGEYQGLDLIPGRVVPIPLQGATGEIHKIPHIAWSPLKFPQSQTVWGKTILEGIEENSFVYHLHSFMVIPEKMENRLADTEYDGCLIASCVRSDNIYGCQFHPEKSSNVGLKILRNFCKL